MAKLKMTSTPVTTWAMMAGLLIQVCLGQDYAFQNQVESRVRKISENDEAFGDPNAVEQLRIAMRSGGDWDGALVRLVDADKYEEHFIDTAIGLLEMRGSMQRPEIEAVLIPYFKRRIDAARSHDRADPLFVPVTRAGVGSLVSEFAKYGGPELLLVVLDFAGSKEELSEALLEDFTLVALADALLKKGDARHLEGMRNLLAATKNETVREMLTRAISTTPSEVAPGAFGRPSEIQTSMVSQPDGTPVAQTFDLGAEHRTRALPWPWLVGVLTFVAIIAVVWKRRT